MKTNFHYGNALISSLWCHSDSNATLYAKNGPVGAGIVFCGWADIKHALMRAFAASLCRNCFKYIWRTIGTQCCTGRGHRHTIKRQQSLAYTSKSRRLPSHWETSATENQMQFRWIIQFFLHMDWWILHAVFIQWFFRGKGLNSEHSMLPNIDVKPPRCMIEARYKR